MAVTIQIKRGTKAGLPALAPGEYGLATDTGELFVGGNSGNIQVATLGSDGKIPEGQLPEMDYDPAGSAASVQGNLDVHTNNKENPHGVTATQTGALPLSGGTMTGPITLAADPAAAMQPVTKQYFDQAIGDIGSALDAINGEVI